MSRVKFGDVVKDVKINIDRLNNPYEYYVAGDHMDSEDLTIHRKGCFTIDDVGPAFIRVFKPGQILYGSRRTYLKKIAVANFEGVCANTTFVFETKDPHAFEQRLLPFIMLSKDFTTWSIAKSKGSTNPYVLFSDLADFEFELPSLEEQKVLADKLWAAYRLKEAYKKLLVATDEMVKSQFIEMSYCGAFPLQQLKENVEVLRGVSYKPDDVKDTLSTAETIILRSNNIDNGLVNYENLVFVNSNRVSDQQVVTTGDIIMCGSNGSKKLVGKAALIECEPGHRTSFGAFCLCIRCKNTVLPRYLATYFQTSIYRDEIESLGAGSNILNIKPSNIQDLEIPLPPIEEQMRFVSIAEQADKSKFELKQCIENIDKVIKSLING